MQRDSRKCEHGFRLSAPDGDGHGNRPGPHREWHRQRIETADPPRPPGLYAGLTVIRPLLLCQKLPPERRNNQPARDAHHRQINAEKYQQPGPQHHGPQQQRKAVDGDTTRKHTALVVRQIGRESQEKRRRFYWIYYREQSCKRQQECAEYCTHISTSVTVASLYGARVRVRLAGSDLT